MRKTTLSNDSAASHPGGIQLSTEKVRAFHPELYPEGVLRFFAPLFPKARFWRRRLKEHLMFGDSRAAVVISLEPLLVAAYTDELDCVAVLRFPADIAGVQRLETGSRLLTVNLYQRGTDPVSDLRHGPASYHRYRNFGPLIADFLSDDVERIEMRKRQISEAEWQLAWRLGGEYLADPSARFRDGKPLNCWNPG